MATLDELADALITADASGDTEAVRALSEAYEEQKAMEAQKPLLEDTGQGRFTSALSNVGRGALSIAPNVVGGLGYLTGSETMQRAGTELEEGIASLLPVNPLYQEEFTQKAANVVGQGISTLASGGTGGLIGKGLGGSAAIGRGAQAGALVPAFLAGTREGGQEAERYGMTGGSAYARALLGGGIELATEKLLFGLGTETAPIRRMLGESLERGSGAFMKAVGTEAGEEAAAQIGGNFATGVLAPEGVQTPGITEGALESAALGAVGGGFFGGVNALTGRTPVLDDQGNQVTVEGQPVFVEDIEPQPPAADQLEEDVAPLTVEQVQDQAVEEVVTAATQSVMENADVLPVTSQILANEPIQETPVAEQPVPEVQAEEETVAAQAVAEPEPEVTNEEEITAQDEIEEAGGPAPVEELAPEASPEGTPEEGAALGQGEGQQVEVAPQRVPSRRETPRPQSGQTVEFRREGTPVRGVYQGQDELGRHRVKVGNQMEFVASTPAVIESSPIQGVATPDTVRLSAASMRGGKGRRGMTAEATQQVVDQFRRELPKSPEIRVLTAAQLETEPEFQELRDKAAEVGASFRSVEGWLDRRTNTVFLVADQLRNDRRARQVLIHEIIGHGGVMAVATPQEMRRIEAIIRRVAPRIVQSVEANYRGASQEEKTREILARFSEAYRSADPANLPQGWSRAWEDLKRIMGAIIRKLGGDPNAFDDADLHWFYTNAVRSVYENGLLPGDDVEVAASVAPELQMSINFPGTPEAREENRRQIEAGVSNARETQAVFAPFEKENLQYIPTTEQGFKDDASDFLDQYPLEEGAQRVLDGNVPENLKAGEDGRQHVVVAEAIKRLTTAIDTEADPYQKARYLQQANELALKYAREGTQDGRALKSRATANTLLAPIAPVLATYRIMQERIRTTLDKRFDGGSTGVTDKTRVKATEAGEQAGQDIAEDLMEEDTDAQLSEAEAMRDEANASAERIISSLVKPKESKQKVDRVREVYKEHMKKPMEQQAFVSRLTSLGVEPDVAVSLFSIAQNELRGREMTQRLRERATKEKIIAKDSPKLVELLNKLRKKMYPGMNWRKIFESLPDQQLERQKAIYDRLRKDERLRGLTTEEGVALTNELDKAWQRQRRKVFKEELKRQGVLGEKAPEDRKKVENALPTILRAINLGAFNSGLMREAMAKEYGLKVLTAEEAAGLRQMAQEAWQQPEGIQRNRKLAELLTKLQGITGASPSEVINNYWVASVLSGSATMFDTYMSAANGLGNNLLQAGALFARGDAKNAFGAVQQWFQGLRQGAMESMNILAKGDFSVLKRFTTDLNKALEGESNFRPVPLGESMWKNGTFFEKFPAAVMLWTGRLMGAADHINNTATSYGAMAVARALHPEIYGGKGAFTEKEKKDAREQALREITGGAEPSTMDERVLVSKRTREVLEGLLRPEEQQEASFIGDQAAYQNDPIGLFGSIYSGISSMLAYLERRAESMAGDTDAGSRFTRALLTGLAGGLRGLTGTKFMRFGFNFGNDITQYIPGTYLLQKLLPVYGADMSRSQQDLLLGKNIFGLMTAIGVAALFLDKDDEDEGWHIEGNWSGLNNDFKNQLRSQGKEPNTFWRRRADGSIERISYRSWPTSGIMVAVGSMNDQRRYQPAKWSERGVAGNLLMAVGNGALQVKDTTALSGLSEILGASSYSSNPESDAAERVAKAAIKFEGGFFPTLLKDMDSWQDPQNYRPETMMDEMVRNVPLARRGAADGRPMLNLLGEPVQMTRTPWRRVYSESKSGPEYRTLGGLLSRGLSLPEPSTKRTVNMNGTKTTIEALGPRAEWEYARILGRRYKTFLLNEGEALLKMDTERAQKRIRQRAQDMGDQAENELVRYLKANP